MRQSTIHCLFGLVLAVIAVAGTAGRAEAATLKPWKDELFSYPQIVETAEGGALIVVDYREERDLKGRDQVPERRAKPAYVDMGVRKYQRNATIETPGGAIDVMLAGRGAGAAFTVIFVHGRGGDRRLGANDWSFGGNFNRLKNLAIRNGGAYYAPSVPSFDAKGSAAVAGLVKRAKALSPGGPVILAYASMGSFICAGVARDQAAVASLSGLVLMGGAPDGGYPSTAAFKAKVPVVFTHGDFDSVYQANDQIAIFRRLRKAGVPTRFVLFQTGGHGTPVRMTDWRDTLNWIIGQRN